MHPPIHTIYPNEYPVQMLHAKPVPKQLHIMGEMPGPEYTFLCVIGSRKYSSYGKNACSALVKGLKGRPIVIVSGLAIGIDSAAHEAALEVGLKTIAFPGSGLGPYALYPSRNIPLAYRIAESGGAVASPFPNDFAATKWSFPRRNLIMAGISRAVLIVEGGHNSGTMITSRAATDYGRDILAVPGSIFSDLTHAPHTLMKDGAAVISSSNDILRALGFTVEEDNMPKPFKNIAELHLCPEEKLIVAQLQISPRTDTELIRETALTASLFNIFVSQLELKNVVVQTNGKFRLNY